MSNGIVRSLFNRLVMFKPINFLTGEDDEWTEVGELEDGKTLYQNKRCSSIFKGGDRAYNIEGRVFREPNGSCFTNRDSFVDVTFPYMVPDEPEVVDVDENGEPIPNYSSAPVLTVKVGDAWYSSQSQPICIVLSDSDKRNIAAMNDDCNRYASFPEAFAEGMSQEARMQEMLKWMDEGYAQTQ